MTFEEWVNSQYNTCEAFINCSGNVQFGDIMIEMNSKDLVIVDGEDYYLAPAFNDC